MTPRLADPRIGHIAGLAAGHLTLAELSGDIRRCVACDELAVARTTVVVGDLPSRPRLLIVGEAPGATEDVVGRPFVGKGGQLLDALLSEVGIDRSEAAVLNVLKCRPPANRTPTTAEARRCSGWLDRQVALLRPPLVLTLGRSALTWAMDAKHTIEGVRGVLHEWRGTRLAASYHPSAAMRFGPQGAPRLALAADLRFVAEVLACG
jgi:uracil-DNA glycosylase